MEKLKHSMTQKVVSVVKNIFTTNPLDYWFFLRRTKKAKEMIEDRFGGDLTKENEYDERDYTLDGSDELKELKNGILYMIDQGVSWRTRNACVPISMLVGLYHNSKIVPDYNEMLAFLDYLEREWVWRENSGASAPTLIPKLVSKWNELHPDRKVEYRRVQHNSAGYKDLFDKGYLLAGGRSTFPSYTRDVLDRIINVFSYADSVRRGGHYISVIKGKFLSEKDKMEVRAGNAIKAHHYDPVGGNINEDETEMIVNQYPSTKANQINIYAHPKMELHVRNWYWYSWFYAILPIEAVESNPVTIPRVGTVTEYTPILAQKVKEGWIPTFNDYSWPEQKLKELIDIALSNYNITKK